MDTRSLFSGGTPYKKKLKTPTHTIPPAKSWLPANSVLKKKKKTSPEILHLSVSPPELPQRKTAETSHCAFLFLCSFFASSPDAASFFLYPSGEILIPDTSSRSRITVEQHGRTHGDDPDVRDVSHEYVHFTCVRVSTWTCKRLGGVSANRWNVSLKAENRFGNSGKTDTSEGQVLNVRKLVLVLKNNRKALTFNKKPSNTVRSGTFHQQCVCVWLSAESGTLLLLTPHTLTWWFFFISADKALLNWTARETQRDE